MLRVIDDPLHGRLQKAFAAERIQALMDIRRSQEVDAAACHALMMRKQEELMQRLHKAEEALQHSTRDSILCRRPPPGKQCLPCNFILLDDHLAVFVVWGSVSRKFLEDIACWMRSEQAQYCHAFQRGITLQRGWHCKANVCQACMHTLCRVHFLPVSHLAHWLGDAELALNTTPHACMGSM